MDDYKTVGSVPVILSRIDRGAKVIDNRTGEELVYYGFDGIYALCLDSRCVTLYLLPDRICPVNTE